jgi:hypothetical protein
MTRTRIDVPLPAEEKHQIKDYTDELGISMSVYLRILAIEDRERRERAATMRKMFPDKPTPLPEQ